MEVEAAAFRYMSSNPMTAGEAAVAVRHRIGSRLHRPREPPRRLFLRTEPALQLR
jgi:hypothetical protein